MSTGPKRASTTDMHWVGQPNPILKVSTFLVWEGQRINGVVHKELIAPRSVEGVRDGELTLDVDIDIATPVPGWYTVLTKVTGQ